MLITSNTNQWWILRYERLPIRMFGLTMFTTTLYGLDGMRCKSLINILHQTIVLNTETSQKKGVDALSKLDGAFLTKS